MHWTEHCKIHSVDIAQLDTIEAKRSHRAQNTIPLIYSWKEKIIYNDNTKTKWKNKSEKNISSSSEMNPCKNSLIYYLESENKLEM